MRVGGGVVAADFGIVPVGIMSYTGLWTSKERISNSNILDWLVLFMSSLGLKKMSAFSVPTSHGLADDVECLDKCAEKLGDLSAVYF